MFELLLTLLDTQLEAQQLSLPEDRITTEHCISAAMCDSKKFFCSVDLYGGSFGPAAAPAVTALYGDHSAKQRKYSDSDSVFKSEKEKRSSYLQLADSGQIGRQDK